MITAQVKGNTLTITAPLDKWKPSASGKSQVIGTGGFVIVPGREDLKFGLNIIKK